MKKISVILLLMVCLIGFPACAAEGPVNTSKNDSSVAEASESETPEISVPEDDPHTKNPTITPEDVIPGEVVPDAIPPETTTLQIGGKQVHYLETREMDGYGLECQNAELYRRMLVYLDDEQNIYTFDENLEFRSFDRAEPLRGGGAPIPENAPGGVDSTIAAAAAFGIELDKSQLDSSGTGEWGGPRFVFKMGKDPLIEDYVTVTLDKDRTPFSLIVNRSGFDSLDEVNIAFFDDAFAEYSKEQKSKIAKASVQYKYYGNIPIAQYSIIFEDEDGALWGEIVSFADVE